MWAFLNLLSSQRELLQLLNRESTNHKVHTTYCSRRPHMMISGNHQRLQHVNAPVNSSNCELSTTYEDDVVYSKRFSLGLGNEMLDNFACGDDSFSKLEDPLDSYSYRPENSVRACKHKMVDHLGLDDMMSYSKKRRLSGASLCYQPAFAQKTWHPNPLHHATQRRQSLFSLSGATPVDDFAQDDNYYSVQHCRTAVKHGRTQTRPTQPQKRRVMPPFLTRDIEKAQKTMISLSTAMEKSQKSQQDIHNWDRKVMGLKRSHSKTMRLSTRSRKKLRAMLKKQIGLISTTKKR